MAKLGTQKIIKVAILKHEGYESILGKAMREAAKERK